MDESFVAMVNQVPRFQPGSVGELPSSAWERIWSAINRNPRWTLAAIVAFYPSLFAGPALTVVARPGGWLARLPSDGARRF